ncbi:FAD-dependent oxidoreductase [Ornithinimicrobium humiphilum]|uniref:D-amino-acid dehydrogenase n=1 Tax=Ornithinimicrobium humiphilum TaxID=125288 RepID=A0A543KM91_9MICO|nr:FAD-dependent oxidoreductase [Ornithinimicrobium humiphilum]TQM96197.1 D-amino-acid dehydrogenase [Ornithinimicrobium humiphilum]
MSGSVRRVAVVGAGMVGLATAWFLRERGVEVTVLDRKGVAAGASWGNAGWLTPAIATPLPEPAVLRYGMRAVLSANSPVYVPPTLDPRLARFVAGFVRHSTDSRWEKAMQALIPVNARSLDAFDHLAAHGVAAEVLEAEPFVAAYDRAGDVQVLLDEFVSIEKAGGKVEHELIGGDEARRREPALSDAVQAAIIIHGQRYLRPVEYVDALAEAVRAQGTPIHVGTEVLGIEDLGSGGVRVQTSGEGGGTYDAVVVATGAWLGDLASQFGVRQVVQAGRGYSFSVPTEHMPAGPLYFPAARVALTPLGDRLRVAGMMEFRRADAALDPRRITAIVEATRPLLRGADLDDRQDEWVGSRPVTCDGLPLIGGTESERVFVAGGHGMWGITLGPITGQLLAEQITTGQTPSELAPFDPLRRLSWAPSRLTAARGR